MTYFEKKAIKILTIITILTLISALIHIRADYLNRQVKTYIFKPLTTGLVILICLLQTPEVSTLYKYLIFSGLIFSLIGDIYLMLPTDRFISGLFSFLIAHIVYMIAFISDQGFQPNLLYLIPVIVYGVILLRILLPHTGSYTIPVIIYSVILMLLLWQAVGRAGVSHNHSAMIALVGVILFVLSDSILSFNRFVRSSGKAQLLTLGTYYTAQLFIAFSA
jgi:uncharacterized membrane protein YhhN